MLPAGFEAAVGLTIQALTALAGHAETLSELWDIASGAKTIQGAYSKFAGMIRRARPAATVEQIRTLYRAARYYADPKPYLAAYDKDVIIDRRLADVVESPTGLAPGGGLIRYGVDVYVTFPGTGDTKKFSVWVESDEFRSTEDVVDQATRIIMGMFKASSKWTDYGGSRPSGLVSGVVTNFERYVAVGVA